MNRFAAGCLLVHTWIGWTATQANAQPVLELRAENYDPFTGHWLDSSGNFNHGDQLLLGARPSLVAGQTPNGSSVVRFDGNDYLRLLNDISSPSFTAFAFLRISGPASETKTIVGGAAHSGAFQYRIDANNNRQQALRQDQLGLGHGFNPLTPPDFYSINATVSATGGSYRFNGMNDLNNIGSPFTSPTNMIGSRGFGVGGTVESFYGDIAEIRLYTYVLDTTQRAAVEAELLARYAAVPEPASLLLVSTPVLGLALRTLIRRRRKESPQ